MTLPELLEPAVRTSGVAGAMVVSRDDGLLVAGTIRSEVNGSAVAALASRLAERVRVLAEAMGRAEPELIELWGSEGTLLAAPAGAGLLLVAVVSSGADPEPVRRELLRLTDKVA